MQDKVDEIKLLHISKLQFFKIRFTSDFTEALVRCLMCIRLGCFSTGSLDPVFSTVKSPLLQHGMTPAQANTAD